MKTGFTLIELLVVVLIIGILAAVALPQYQVAVAKSRLAAVIPTVKSMKQAVEVYYLANGEYINNMGVYDIDFPDCHSYNTAYCKTSKNVIFDIFSYGGAPCKDVAAILVDKANNAINGFHICLGQSTPNSYCSAAADNHIANQVCKSMGGTLQTRNVPCINLPPYTNCNRYLLP